MSIKKFLFIFTFAMMFMVTGCIEDTPGPGDDDPKDVDNPIDGKLTEIEEWLIDRIPNFTEIDLTLPTTHPEIGGEIIWESFDEDVITSQGVITLATGAVEVLLMYEIIYQEHSKTDFILVNVSADTIQEVADKFLEQFSAIITRDYDVNTDFNPEYTISWNSSHPEYFSNEGKFNRAVNTSKFTLSFTVTSPIGEESFTKDLLVQGYTLGQKRDIVSEWIVENYIPGRLITNGIQFPTSYEPLEATITWSSSNSNVISSDGVITRYPFDRYVLLTANVSFSDHTFVQCDFDLVIQATTVETMEEKIDSFVNAIALEQINRMSFTSYSNITQSYNHLLFYENEDHPVIEQIIMLNSQRPAGTSGSRPGTKLTSTEFIVIHDTANNRPGAGAKMHANLLTNGFTASWHISIDDKETYLSIPWDEVAWHAGDGSRAFGLLSTDVPANGNPYPVITIDGAGYYELNGVKSIVKAPLKANGLIPTTSDIAGAGIYTEIGDDGKYLINRTYFNTTYQLISNHGGNRHSIGFESSVHAGSDYMMTLRRTAQLVAELIIEHDLDISRVMQHNNFSGKPCPLALIRMNYWTQFLDMIAIELYAKENLADVYFDWTTLTPGVLSSNGKIAQNIGQATEVNYQVEVTYTGGNFVREFTTKLG